MQGFSRLYEPRIRASKYNLHNGHFLYAYRYTREVPLLIIPPDTCACNKLRRIVKEH